MFNTKILENLMVAFCFCITLALHLLIFNHYFSLQEGWWETYAYLVNRGEVINKDFYLAWTPLFVYINAFYQKIFGINFFAFACIGVVAAMIQVILLYAVLREFFSKVSSILGATFASFLWFGMETYIAKDYHTYVFIIEFSTLLFLVKSIKNENSKKGIIYQILGILFLVLLFFIKQNVGLVLFASLFVSYAFISSSVKDYLKRIGFLLLFTIIFFASINFIMPFDPSSITDNDSKGSLWTIATRFWTSSVNFETLLNGFYIFCIILILFYLRNYIKDFYTKILLKIISITTKEFRIFILILIYIFLIYGFIYIMNNFGISMYRFISAAIGLILFLMYAFFIKNNRFYNSQKYVFITLSMTAISYAGTFADLFTANSNMICIAFLCAFIINYTRIKHIKNILVCILLISIYFNIESVLYTPYQWNYNYQTNVFNARTQSTYPQLKGIYMDERTANIYNYFMIYVNEKSKSKDDFYFFNLPIMYLLNNKIPPYRLVTHWFDVSSSKAIEEEYNEFIKSPTRNIVMYQYQTYFSLAHKRFQGKSSFKQADFYEIMNKWVKEGKYKFIGSIIVPYDDASLEEEKNHILKNLLIILQNNNFFGMSRDEFTSWLKENGITLTYVKHEEVKADDQNSKQLDENRQDLMQNGDILQMDGSVADLSRIFPQLGVAPIESTFFNTINIYERQEN